jgi:SAM-dependent methyltransferase
MKRTIDYYEREGKSWKRTHSLKSLTDWRLDQFNKFKKILSSGKVLDIGCGPGIDAKMFLDAGFGYIGIDAAGNFIKIAKKEYPNVGFYQMKIEDLKFINTYFDGFWASASLLHVKKVRIERVLNKIEAVCKSGAIGLISIKKGRGERSDKNGRFFAYYSKNGFEKILNKANFSVVDFEEKTDYRPNQPNWLIFYVKRKEKQSVLTEI